MKDKIKGHSPISWSFLDGTCDLRLEGVIAIFAGHPIADAYLNLMYLRGCRRGCF